VDPDTGCNYYIRMTDLQSSWRMPLEGALVKPENEDQDGLEDFDFDSQVNGMDADGLDEDAEPLDGENAKNPKWRFWRK